ncbi:hypothetical protein HanPI659440_Chr09g0345111 [Helianthus annuus]|nr:hypothetical protein HanPI659440_Chr09g0345111 [Helianthus annuus]
MFEFLPPLVFNLVCLFLFCKCLAICLLFNGIFLLLVECGWSSLLVNAVSDE